MTSKTSTSKANKKQWYAATLIMRLRVEDDKGPYNCDEQVRLIHARTADKAYNKAYKLGKSQETVILNEAGEMTYIEFVGLAELNLVNGTLDDGVKVKSRLFVHSAPQILGLMKEELSLFSASPPKEWRIVAETIPLEDQ